MTQNNEIMDRILGATTIEHAPQKEVVVTSVDSTDEEIFSQERIVTVRYKVYIAILIVLGAIGALELFPTMIAKKDAAHAAYNQTKAEIVALESQKTSNEQDLSYLQQVEENQTTLENCLNNEDSSACTALPDTWNVDYKGKTIKDFSIPLSYLQLNSLYSPKMPVDEKKVLRNLNEYLIRDGEIIQWVNARNGDILSIDIGDSESVEGSEVFFSVPISFSIEFDRVGDLISFVRNVEKRLIEDSHDRILYKIQEVGYDIVASNEPQTTDIEMIAYYYHDPRFLDTSVNNIEDTNNKENGRDDCRYLPNNLLTCTPYTCIAEAPFVWGEYKTEIVGISDGKCLFIQKLPNNWEMVCEYSDSERIIASEYYEDTLNWNINTTTKITLNWDGVSTSTNNSLQNFIDNWTCVVSGY